MRAPLAIKPITFPILFIFESFIHYIFTSIHFVKIRNYKYYYCTLISNSLPLSAKISKLELVFSLIVR